MFTFLSPVSVNMSVYMANVIKLRILRCGGVWGYPGGFNVVPRVLISE